MSEEKNHIDTALLIDDSEDNLFLLKTLLSKYGFKIALASSGKEGLKQAKAVAPDIILLDIMMSDLSGYEVCARLKEDDETKEIPVIFVTALRDKLDVVQGFHRGAVDFITKPIHREELIARVTAHLTIRRLQRELLAKNEELETKVAERTADLTETLDALKREISFRKSIERSLKTTLEELEKIKRKLQAENLYLQEEIKLSHNFENIVGVSVKLKKVLSQVEQVAKTDAAALILGETGVGKELIARAIHAVSRRRDKPLVKVNCSALPSNLIENELFGHERGAFTGAFSRKIGRFELADGGTLFLDEIGELPLELQPKLLRVLQEGEFERLGGSGTHKSDVRIIAATNRDLKSAIRAGAFRDDLYFRLSVFPIVVPPLRERPEDIKPLAKRFLSKFNKKHGKSVNSLTAKTIESFEKYSWPGNVRELENMLERAVILAEGEIVDIPAPNLSRALSQENENENSLKDAEKATIRRALEKCNWVVEGPRGAAKVLDVAPSTLRDKMKKFDLKRPELPPPENE